MKRKVMCMLESNNVTLQILRVCGIKFDLPYILRFEMIGICVSVMLNLYI
jgi:hypothetical protein